MNLSPYLESVRTGVQNAAALADENTQQVAYKLGTAVESATRLAMISALSDAAGVISAELAPSSVELRMSGDDPEFVVSVSSPRTEPTLLLPESGSGQEETADLSEADEDEPLSRISLRLPASVKARVDEQAAKDGISTNAWLVRAVMDALADRRAGGVWPEPPPPPPPPGGSSGSAVRSVPMGFSALVGSSAPAVRSAAEKRLVIMCTTRAATSGTGQEATGQRMTRTPVAAEACRDGRDERPDLRLLRHQAGRRRQSR